MTARALLSALGLWIRNPKGMLILNLAWFFLAFAVFLLTSLLPDSLIAGGSLRAGFIAFELWLLFCLLVRATYHLDAGQKLSWKVTWEWFKDGWVPRFVLALVWILCGLSVLSRFASLNGLILDSRLKLLLGAGIAAWLWISLAALLSAGLDAPLDQPSAAPQKAGFLAAIAFLPSALVAAALGTWFSGLWGFVVGTKGMGTALLWAPLVLAPLFTPTFYAAYLYYLAQGIKDRSQGRRPLDQAPTFKELLRPWL